MTDRIERFVVGGRPRVEVSVGSGDVTVLAGEPGAIEVRVDGSAGSAVIEQLGDTVVVEQEKGWAGRGSIDVVVLAPAGAVVQTTTGSGDVTVELEVGELTATAGSGDVRVRRVGGDAKVKTASGDLTVEQIGGRLEATTASGDVRIGDVGGDLSAKTASGDVVVERVGRSAELTSASGSLRVGCFEGAELAARSMSGDISIGIPPRRRIDVDMDSISGELRNRLPAGDGSPPEVVVRLRISTVTGDVTLRGA
jgi:DUF4097 and DUF4098 domain-containing protein YvlB